MKKKSVIIAFLVLAAAGGALYLRFGGKDAPVVQTTPVIRGDIVRSVSATGRIQAVNTVNIGAQVSGTIRLIHVDYNSVVKKGQLLAEIDPSLLEASVRQAQASVRSAKASLAEARAVLDDAAKNLRRSEDLFSRGYISKTDFESAQSTHTAALARVETTGASLAQAEADLMYKKINLGHTRIVSPIEGVVIDRAVDQGQTVNASQSAPTLFSIAEDLSRMQVEASIDEADIGLISRGQIARFTVDAFPDVDFEGTVREIRLSPSTSENVVTYIVVMGVENHELKLMPGMTANVTVIVESRNDVLKVASSSLRFRPPNAEQQPRKQGGQNGQGRGAAIWSFEEGKLERHSVKPGISDGMYTEISGDIEEGMEAVTAIDYGSSSSGGGAAFGIAPRR